MPLRSSVIRSAMRRSDGGGGGVSGSGDGLECFADIADLAAFDTAASPDVCIAFVETLKDYYTHDPASAAAADAINYTVVVATGGGRWLRQGRANEEWARAFATAGGVWVSSAGNNENVGTLGSPLRTNAEVDRRLHGIVVPRAGVFSHTLLTNSDDNDPVLYRDVLFYTVDQTAILRIVGGRTVAASGTVTSAQALSPSTNLPVEIVTSVSLDAQLNKYIRIFSAGPAFRCSAWVDAILIAGSRYRLSCPTAQNGVTPSAGNVNPVAGDTFEVYNLITVPDVLINGDHVPAGVQLVEVDVSNTLGGGFAEISMPDDGIVIWYGCAIRESFYYNKGASVGFDNCLHLVPWTSPVWGNFGLTAGLYKGGTYSFNGSGRTSFGANDNPMFSGSNLIFRDCFASFESDGLAFFDPFSPLITVGAGCDLNISRVWGVAGGADGIDFDDCNSRVRFNITPNISGLGTAIRLAAGLLPGVLFSTLDLTDLRDWLGNELLGPDNSFGVEGLINSMVNREGAAMAPGDIVRMTTNGMMLADNTSALESAVFGVCVTDPGNAITGAVVTAGPVLMRFTAAPAQGDSVWLSSTPGQATTTPPSTTAKRIPVFLGKVLRAGITGNRAIVGLQIQNFENCFNSQELFADQLDFPDNADWAVNAMAPAAQDTVNAAITVRRFDDTTEEGVGFIMRLPQATARLRILIIARAQTAPAGTRTVGLKLYARPISDDDVLPAWVSVVLTDFTLPATANFQFQYYEVTYVSYAPDLNPADVVQFELTRINPTGGTELTGDFDLQSIIVWALP